MTLQFTVMNRMYLEVMDSLRFIAATAVIFCRKEVAAILLWKENCLCRLHFPFIMYRWEVFCYSYSAKEPAMCSEMVWDMVPWCPSSFLPVLYIVL